MMDWDHIGSDKIAAVSYLINTNRKREVILDEIAKCELVCANCHRYRTWKRAHGLN